jgi:hypothetical protein
MPSKKPRTEKQMAASRANGARSKGPKTARGKAQSSKNSVGRGNSSGLLAESVLFDVENKVEFDAILAGLIAEHDPQSATERILVENMAVARWQQLRNWAMQKSAMNAEIARLDSSTGDNGARAADALRAPACSSELLLRYAIAADRQFHRSLSRLLKLQDRRTEGAQVPEKKNCAERSPEAIENANPVPEKPSPNPAKPPDSGCVPPNQPPVSNRFPSHPTAVSTPCLSVHPTAGSLKPHKKRLLTRLSEIS